MLISCDEAAFFITRPKWMSRSQRTGANFQYLFCLALVSLSESLRYPLFVGKTTIIFVQQRSIHHFFFINVHEVFCISRVCRAFDVRGPEMLNPSNNNTLCSLPRNPSALFYRLLEIYDSSLWGRARSRDQLIQTGRRVRRDLRLTLD